MIEGDRVITTDTLHYDTQSSMAHVLGPSKITSKTGVIETRDGYFDTKTSKSKLFGRSTVNDKDKAITGDSLYYNDKTGQSEGYGDVIYVDKKNNNSLLCQRFNYNEKTGKGWATGKLLAKDYSQKDTLYVHADSVKLLTSIPTRFIASLIAFGMCAPIEQTCKPCAIRWWQTLRTRVLQCIATPLCGMPTDNCWAR